jgi:hypothetical protein
MSLERKPATNESIAVSIIALASLDLKKLHRDFLSFSLFSVS